MHPLNRAEANYERLSRGVAIKSVKRMDLDEDRYAHYAPGYDHVILAKEERMGYVLAVWGETWAWFIDGAHAHRFFTAKRRPILRYLKLRGLALYYDGDEQRVTEAAYMMGVER